MRHNMIPGCTRRLLFIATIAAGLILSATTVSHAQNRGRGRSTNTQAVEKKPKPARQVRQVRQKNTRAAEKKASPKPQRGPSRQARENKSRSAPANDPSRMRDRRSRESRKDLSNQPQSRPESSRRSDRNSARPLNRNDSRRPLTPEHRSRGRSSDRYEENAGLGIRFDFDDWSLDLYFGDHRRRYRYPDCRSGHRCRRSACGFCFPPPRHYRSSCRPSYRCGWFSCHDCFPPYYWSDWDCRPSVRCGLNRCGYCHPPAPIYRYDGFSFERRLSHGWDEIQYGDYRDAKDTFECLIEKNPYDARPRTGLAIAQGLRNRENTATREMRRAVDLNPAALCSVPLTSSLRWKIEELLCEYEDRLRWDCDDEDDLFMVASLQTTLGHFDDAYDAIRSAIRYGDCSSEAQRLRNYLSSMLGSGSRYGRGGRGW